MTGSRGQLLGVCRRLVDAIPDHRDQSRIEHQMFEMVMARVCGIRLRHSPAAARMRTIMTGWATIR